MRGGGNELAGQGIGDGRENDRDVLGCGDDSLAGRRRDGHDDVGVISDELAGDLLGRAKIALRALEIDHEVLALDIAVRGQSFQNAILHLDQLRRVHHRHDRDMLGRVGQCEAGRQQKHATGENNEPRKSSGPHRTSSTARETCVALPISPAMLDFTANQALLITLNAARDLSIRQRHQPSRREPRRSACSANAGRHG